MRQPLRMPDADVNFYPAFFSIAESDAYFKMLAEKIAWEALTIGTPRGRVSLPRLVAWYGEVEYKYSGIMHPPRAWTPTLLEIKSRIEIIAAITFNSVLLNYYRDGRDSVAWHADDEPELGRAPVIGSVSFGATREFQFRHKSKKDLKANIELTDGSLLMMRGATQRHWLHRIPKTETPVGARINLTFRYTAPRAQ